MGNKVEPRVVIIDDDDLLVSVFTAILRAKKYEVSTDLATNAEGSNIYIIDYHCGGKNGLEIAWEIKSGNPNNKIILISGLQRKAAAEVMSALEEGIIDMFLPKPFSPESLLRHIELLSRPTD